MTAPSRLRVLALVLAASIACGGSSDSPTAPAVVVIPTKSISLSGALSFGEVVVGSSREINLTISNGGNTPLTVTGLSITGEMNNHVAYTWANGVIPAGGSQVVGVRFVPNFFGSYSGTLIVSGDQSSGTNSIAISGTALPSFAGRWKGGHRIDSCTGSGSIADLLCTQGRPSAFPPGSIFIFEAEISQNGTSVTGTLNIGGIIGPVAGVVTSSGVLNVRGTLTSTAGFTSTLTSFNITMGGGQTSWSGAFSQDVTFRGILGTAVIVGSMNNVNKQ